MPNYEDKLLAAAHKDGHTASVVAQLPYPDVASLCGIKLGPKGESPVDFFYENVRRAVARSLVLEEWLAAIEAKRADIESRLLSAGVPGRVYADEDGNIVVGAT